MKDVSVIIVNYNSSEMALQAVSSLKKYCSGLNLEIIIVDNNSKNKELEILKKKEHLVDHLILNKKNVGFGTANNIGTKFATGNFLLFLNPDTLVLNDAPALFIEEWLKLTNVGMLGCFQLNSDLTENHSYGSFSAHKPHNFLKSEFHQNITKQVKIIFDFKTRKTLNTNSAEKKQLVTTQVDWINGACLFTTSDIYKKIGGFDEKFFLFSEEVDLQRRLDNFNLKRYVINGPKIVHLHENYRIMNPLTRVFFYKGYFTYCKKWYSKIVFLFTKLLFIIIILLGSILDLKTQRYSLKNNFHLLMSLT